MHSGEHKAAEPDHDELKERVDRLEAIVDMAGVGVIVIDSAGEVEFVNDIVSDITNYSKIEIYREGLKAFLSQESFRTLRDMLEGGSGRAHAEMSIIRKRGRRRTCDARIECSGMGEQRKCYLYLMDITEQKEMAEQVRQSEEKYRYLFETIHHGIFVSTAEGRFTDCNPALLAMLGYNSKDELLALDLSRDVYNEPEDRERFRNVVAQADQIKDFEVVFKKKTGEEVDVLLSARALRNELNEVAGYQGIMIDITERKRREERAREASEEKYRRLFEGIRDPVYTSSRDGTYSDCNPAFLETFGYLDKEEFLSLHIPRDTYKNPDDRRFFQETIERDGYIKDFQVVLKRKTGEEITVLITAQAIRNGDGEIEGYEGIMKDITQRNQMEKDLTDANDFLNTVIEASPDSIIVADRHGDVIMYNAAAEGLFGYPFTEVVGRKAKAFNLYPRRLARRTREMIMEDRGTSVPGRKGILLPIEFHVQNSAGEMIETTLSASILYDGQGEEIGSIAIFRDMREVLKIKRKLREIQDQLVHSERLAAMGRLTSQIAHEINNPLYGLMNTLELLKGAIPEDSRRRRLLDMSLSEVERLSAMLKNMLTFSRPGEEARVAVDMNVFLQGSLLLMEKQLKESGIRLVTQYGDQMPKVEVSQNQMRQVILNMLKNAIEAMPQGGSLFVATMREAASLKITIRDTGIGMTEEVRKKIFDAFYTTKEQVKGVGLGLSVCYGIVRDHGGEIQVESTPGKGSAFTIVMPVKDGSADG